MKCSTVGLSTTQHYYNYNYANVTHAHLHMNSLCNAIARFTASEFSLV